MTLGDNTVGPCLGELTTDPETASFAGLWKGGYYEGDPLDPHARSHYSAIDVRQGYPDRPIGLAAEELGFISVLYATYLTTIRKQLPRDAVVLEIGPGRGGWTRALLTENPKHIYALDALPADHNGFWDYVGRDSRVDYHQVDGFSCSPVPNNSIDFFFSFGVFCHISRRGTAQYFQAIRDKMRAGALGVCMISDYIKLGKALGVEVSTEEHQNPEPGRWYHLGVEWFCDMLRLSDFEVIDPDIGIIVRDPIVRFRRK